MHTGGAERREVAMRRWRAVLVGAALALPGATMAQQPAPREPHPATLQRAFVFLDDALRVTIAGEAPGTIQVVRGERGRIDLTARGLGASPAAGLTGDTPSELTLVSAGAARADYVLVVPADVRVTISRAGHPGVTLGTLDREARWSWPAQPARTAELPHS